MAESHITFSIAWWCRWLYLPAMRAYVRLGGRADPDKVEWVLNRAIRIHSSNVKRCN
jgi:hypothetical protein